MPREIVKLIPNVPHEIALKYPQGKLVSGTYGEQMMFSLEDEKIVYLDLEHAQRVAELGVAPGETFLVVKRWTGKKGDKSEFDCWLSPSTENVRAQREMQKANATREDLQGQLAASIAQAQTRKPPAVSPSQGLPDRGNGTYGPVAAPAPAVRQIPTKRQFADAFALFLVDAGRATRAAEIALGADGGSVRFDSRDVAAIATSMFIEAAKQGFVTWNGGDQ